MTTSGNKAASTGYPRTTSLDFLTRCRPATAAFYRYWDGKRRDRAMPSRADIDPLEMSSWLAGTALVDVKHTPDGPAPYELRYRLVGTRPTALRGQENYRLVITGKTHVYDWDRTPATDGFSREAETLLLPLSADGETVDMVLVYQEVDTLR
jgi:hypothetical protein